MKGWKKCYFFYARLQLFFQIKKKRHKFYWQSGVNKIYQDGGNKCVISFKATIYNKLFVFILYERVGHAGNCVVDRGVFEFGKAVEQAGVVVSGNAVSSFC